MPAYLPEGNLPLSTDTVERSLQKINALLVAQAATLLTATAALDFPSISAAATATLTITVTGAAVNDAVVLGLPAAPTAGIVFQAYVSSANTVTVSATNITGSPVNPASATYRATVIHI